MARQTYTVESLGESSTTSTSNTTKATLTFTPDASSTYWLFASAEINCASTTDDHRVRAAFAVSGGAALQDWAAASKEASTPIDYVPVFTIAQFAEGASPASRSFIITFNSFTAGDSSHIRNARITAIKANAADAIAEVTGLGNTSSTTYQTMATLTFTPGSTGDYLIIANAVRGMDTNTTAGRTRLNHTAGTTYGDMVWYVDDDFDSLSWSAIAKINLTGSNTFQLQMRSESGTPTYIQYARVLALRLDVFANNYFTSTYAPQDGSNASYATEASLTQTPENTEHVIIAAGSWNTASTSVSGYLQFTDGTTVFDEGIREGPATTAYLHSGSCYRATLPASSITWSWQSKYESSITVNVAGMAIAVLQTGDTPAGGQPARKRMGGIPYAAMNAGVW